MQVHPALYTTSLTEDHLQWYVWDMYRPLPPQPVFFGTMEDAGLVADALNRRATLPSRVQAVGE